MFNQICALINKNLLVSLRNQEILMDSIIPMIVAIMLALKPQLSTLNQILPIAYALAIFTTSRSIMIRLVEEKSKRYRETQRIMGMNKNAYMLGWLLTAYIRMLIALLVFELSQLIFNILFNLDWKFFYRDSFIQLSWPYFIYGFTAINQSFLFASLFNDTRIAGEVSTFFCVGLSFLVFFTFMESAASSLVFYIIIGIFSPQCTIAFGYVASLTAGYNRLGAKFPFYDPRKPQPMNIFPVDLINQYYDVQASGYQELGVFFLYLILFLYFDQVIPNEYGTSKKPLFFLDFLKKSYKDILLTQPESQHLKESPADDISSAIYHEQMNIKCQPTIIIDNLNKSFGNYKAVNDLTLRLYENQIFCLLGHNGAGKTTTISVLTGMLSKTSGHVTMYGQNIDTELDLIRKNLGLCTQKDCLYEELTVLEHLQFISKIKGCQLSNDQYEEILHTTELIDEAQKLVQKLSGGSKRKLSLALALVGEAQIIFLDEPTSGMDAYSRRAIWNILARIKEQNKTIILTTHHLDEADLLANRIGIMSKGQLLAVGSVEFIKKQFGEGYTLCIRGGNMNNKIVPQFISEAHLIQEQSNESMLTYLLPFTAQDKYTELFKNLEQNGIKIELKLNTLEDAFIKIGQDEEKFLAMKERSEFQEAETSLKGIKEDVDVDENEELIVPDCVKDAPKYNFTNQCTAMFIRRFYTTIRTDTNLLAFIMPILTFILGLLVAEFVQFSGKMAHNEQSQLFLKIAILGAVGIIGFSFNSTLYVTLPVLEKEISLKQVLRGTGCRVSAYWLGTFCFDSIIYCILTLSYFIASFILQLSAVTDYWWQTLIIFICFGYAYITFTYVCGFFFTQVEKAMRLFVIFTFFCDFCIPFVILGVFNYFYITYDQPISVEIIMYILEIIIMTISPFYNFYLAYVAMPNFSSNLSVEFGGMPLITESYTAYCVIMILQGLLFSGIIFIIDFIILQKAPKVDICRPTELLEEDVDKEQHRIMESSCDDLIQSKVIGKQYSKDGPQVLKNVAFGVKQGEIMGIIGPNGAGKSTLINVFTGLIPQSSGYAQIQNKTYPSIYNIAQHIGICPQYDCIWENLTTQEHLNLFGKMKGLNGEKLKQAVKYFIKTMELYLFRNTKAGQLSGGNKRKLCVANALIGGSDITFFDEPSTGVDPISRRSLFNTLKRNVQLRNCSVIMTTHTIEEAENLSDKLGILITGQFVCIGNPEYLRNKYSSGYQISIKYTDNITKMQLLKQIQYDQNKMKELDENRQRYLSIQIPTEGFSFYENFKLLNELKTQRLIEEFQITDCSLESIFVHFSKLQMEQNCLNGVVFQ